MQDLKKLGFCRGVNLGGWLSQCDYSIGHLDNFITESDIAQIAAWGADHVRIPFDYNIVQKTDGTFLEEGFARLENAVALCGKHGLHVVLDLHKTAGFSFDGGEQETGFFDSEDLQELFCDLWEEMAKRFGGMSDRVAFELLNEVTERRYLQAWRRLIPRCMERIRRHAPQTLVLIGSFWNNSPAALKDLDAPYDKFVVFNVHCYDPLAFTHQKAYWTDDIDREETVRFAQTGVTPAYFEGIFASAAEMAARHDTALYCGEYGVIDKADPADTLAWYRAIHAAFEKMGIARCAWSYKGVDFGLCDPRLDAFREEIVKNL